MAIKIDVSGPQGNAFMLIQIAKKLGWQKQWTEDQIKQVIDEMMSGNYDNLLSVFQQNFADDVELING